VNAPAIYELQSATNSTVEEVLALAAGPTSVAAGTTLRLERIDAHTMRSVTEVSLDSVGRSLPLRDGDILELGAVTNKFGNGVILRGNVANPGHYSWKPGMRVNDLFPEKDALITRDYWLRRGRLGEPSLQFTPFCSPNAASNQLDREQFIESGHCGLHLDAAQHAPGRDGHIRTFECEQ
jgi:hypothetical protein